MQALAFQWKWAFISELILQFHNLFNYSLLQYENEAE